MIGKQTIGMHKTILFIMVGLMMAACTGSATEISSLPPTATLAPIVSMTPRFTATPVPSRTALPTFTFTPSTSPIPPTASDTPTPTEVPPIMGIIASINTVNVREGPGTGFSAFEALRPGTRVEVLGQNAEGNWLNIQLEDGREGWISTDLLRLQDTATPLPSLTPSPDLTALALGTPLPTAVLGGGTITPTPPRSVVSPTPVTATVEGEVQAANGTATPFLPIINVDSINQTATALVGGGILAPTITVQAGATTGTSSGPTPTLNLNATATLLAGSGVGSEGSVSAQQGVDVLAYCNNTSLGSPPPTNLAAGSTIDIWWSWFAKTQDQIQDHINNVIYEVTIDGVALSDWREYRTTTRRESDDNYYAYWYVPAGPLSAGPHEITYRVTWTESISDGYDTFGPGTSNTVQTGSCNFTVR
jgi:uncharacterized protein YgiM (DUF1202 family)